MAIWSDIAKWVGPTVNRNAGGTVETRAAMSQLVVDNLAAHFAGKPLLTPV